MNRVLGKVAIITGGAGGMGKAIASLLAKEGAKVVVAEEIRRVGGEALFVKHDVTSTNDWSEVMRKTLAEFGKLDIQDAEIMKTLTINGGGYITKLKNWKPIHLCWLFRKLGLPIPPLFIGNSKEAVTTNDATNIGINRATLNGTLVHGIEVESGYCWFQYGETTDYGTTTDSQYIEDGASFSAQVTGLKSNTLYHFRAGTGCFPDGTLVHTLEGPTAIENIGEGDIVWSLNLLTNKLELQPVEKIIRSVDCLLNIQTRHGIVAPTYEHPFMVYGKGWVKAALLRAGDYLLSKSGEPTKVIALEPVASKVPVQDIVVRTNHNYFVGSEMLLVHNKTAYGEDKTFRTRGAGGMSLLFEEPERRRGYGK